MKLFTVSSDKENAIIVGTLYLKKIDYPDEEVALFSSAAKGYMIRDEYYYDDGDEWSDEGDRCKEADPSSFVIKDHQLIGFYVFKDWSPLLIKCVLLMDGTVVGVSEDSDSYPEASDTLIYTAFKSRKYSLVKTDEQ